MGLDIKAYKNLKEVKKPEFDEDGELINYETEWQPGASMKWSEKAFPGRGEGIEADKVYTWEKSFGFCAGSYHGYNLWRDMLNKFMSGSAFQELINFADNEGVIGPVVSKKLAKDFKDNSEKAREYSKTLKENAEWWIRKYNEWQEAFELAEENGAVEFC